MHPPLKTGHEKCRKQIDDLERCHKENPFAKFVGVCNSVRVALDKCLYAEYLELRQQNFERHREHREQADQMLRKKCTFASCLTVLPLLSVCLLLHFVVSLSLSFALSLSLSLSLFRSFFNQVIPTETENI